jgi:hypothetical protein
VNAVQDNKASRQEYNLSNQNLTTKQKHLFSNPRDEDVHANGPRNIATKMTQMFHKKLQVSHKNDHIFGEKPIVHIHGKLHQTKK